MVRYLSDPARFSRVTAGVCLVAAPLALLVGTIVHPGLRVGERAQLELIAAHPDRWYANHILGFIAMILLVPAILGLVGIVRVREPLLAHVGGTLAFLGVIAFEGVVVAYGFVAWQMAAGASLGEMTALAYRLKHTPGVVVPLGVMSGLLVPGLGLLALGLIRSGAPRRWCGPVAALGALLFLAGGQSAHMTLMLAGTTLLLAALATLGLHVLRSTDAQWAPTTPTPVSPAAGGTSQALPASSTGG